MESFSVLILRINQLYNSQKWVGFSPCSSASLLKKKKKKGQQGLKETEG